MAGAFRHFYLALNFLTVVPCPWSGWEEEKEKGALARAAAFFPLVGGLLGGILILLDRVLGLFLPSSVTAAAVLLALGLLTAGLHLDGLADTFDGLGAVLKHGREKALQAMRDKYCGPVGVSGLLLVLLFKYSLLASLPPELHPGGLLLMPAASRWLMVVAGWSFSYAHKVAGLGNEFIGRIGWRAAASATLWAGLLLILGGAVDIMGGAGPAGAVGVAATAGGLPALAVGLGVTLAGGLLVAFFFKRCFGGLSGDTLGALNEIGEVMFLMGVLLGAVLAGRW